MDIELSLALKLFEAGDPEAAADKCRAVLAGDPAHAEAHHLMAVLCRETGDGLAALGHIRAAVESHPELPQYHYMLGLVRHDCGALDNARRAFEAGLAIDPDHADAGRNLGIIHQSLGDGAKALDYFVGALELAPDDRVLRRNFLECLSGQARLELPASTARHVHESFGRAEIDEKLVRAAALRCVMASSPFTDGLARAGALGGDCRLALGGAPWFRSLAGNALFGEILIGDILADRQMETLLKEIRRALLHLAMREPDTLSRVPLEFCCALAHQAFNGEYVYPVTDLEEAHLEDLLVRLKAARPGREDAARLAVAAAYLPLGAWLDAAPSNPPAPLAELFRRQLDEPREEAVIEPTIPSLPASAAAGASATSARVKAQYEANPFPRWIKLGNFRARGVGEMLGAAFPHFRPPPTLSAPGPILIAGCGTGHQALIAARRHAQSDILAVDLSRASLAYAKRKADELELGNIRFLEADILDLGGIEERFRHIECSGVLHHMARPMEGWKILTSLLEDGGVMKVALYSRLGRRLIHRARQWIKAEKLPATPAAIRQFRARLLRLDADDPLRRVSQFTDFYSLSGCRDLLFHVQETAYELPEIADCLARLGLELIGMQLPDQRVGEAFRAAFPADKSMTDLANWHRFEQQNPDIFKGMYQFWCAKPPSVGASGRDGQTPANAR
jgi:SAM-dependent methyltransferase